MAVSCLLLGLFTPNLGILQISVCSFRLCGSIVANPIIYRLVLSPSRYEIKQCNQDLSSSYSASHADVLRLVTRPPHEHLLNWAITSVRWWLAFVLDEPIINPLLSACQVDSSHQQYNINLLSRGKNMKLFVDVAFFPRFLHSILWCLDVWLELVASKVCCFLPLIEYLSSSGFSPERS